ncbi:hypothetical protein M0R45_034383 [Rubus argutus]|uniref:Uncharacterized protein n=1 Tax=Rubus argutus TaxID=59490 RepID=A0AAW1VVE9_RUBAR
MAAISSNSKIHHHNSSSTKSSSPQSKPIPLTTPSLYTEFFLSSPKSIPNHHGHHHFPIISPCPSPLNSANQNHGRITVAATTSTVPSLCTMLEPVLDFTNKSSPAP